MRAGRLRHRLTFQQPTTTTNSFGGKIKGWVDYVTLWGAIEPVSGHEEAENHQEEPVTSVNIVVRYYSGLTSNMRIKYGSKYYRISGITNRDERHIELNISAEETKDFE